MGYTAGVKKSEYNVECYQCDTTFVAQAADIRTDLDEGYSEDDYWWIHTYITYCPACQEKTSVDVIDEDAPCCI